MARALRVEMPGGWFWVANRGQNRDVIYLDSGDGGHFLGLAAEIEERFGVEVHAYVLLPTHYHLLVRTPQGGLSRAMHWLDTAYGIWWNRRHGRAGHVFRGRYRALVVEPGAWALEASLRLHLASVTEADLSPAAPGSRLEALRSHRWSSYRVYAGYQPAPKWLHTSALLERAGGSTAAYAGVAEARLAADPAILDPPRHGLVLGGGDYADRVLRRLGRPPAAPKRRIPWPEIVAAVEAVRGAPFRSFRNRYGDPGRDLVWWAARRWGGFSLRAVGEAAGGVPAGTVAVAVLRLQRRSAKDPSVREQLQQVRTALGPRAG